MLAFSFLKNNDVKKVKDKQPENNWERVQEKQPQNVKVFKILYKRYVLNSLSPVNTDSLFYYNRIILQWGHVAPIKNHTICIW